MAIETPKPPQLERTTIHCHACNRYLTVEIDVALEGNHAAVCPCGHEHYRGVKAGKVTEARWDSMGKDPLGADKLNGAKKFQGKPGEAPLPAPAPVVQTVTFKMSIVYTSFQASTGGSMTDGQTDYSAQMFKMMIQDSWSVTVNSTAGSSNLGNYFVHGDSDTVRIQGANHGGSQNGSQGQGLGSGGGSGQGARPAN